MSLRKLIVVLIGCLFTLSFTFAHADQAPVAPKKKWTFMVFLNGNNNLDDFGMENIKGMEKVGSNDEVNIIVQWASYSTQQVKRLYIVKSNDPSRISSPVIQNLGRVDMGSYKSLQEFVKWTVGHYPAEHYFIDVWNHGNGWQKKRALTNRDISHDDLTGNKITTEELGVAMAYASSVMGHKVDIYGSDACLMGMAEVANEMSDSVQYFVGSQEIEPDKGWPYSAILARWEATSGATADQVSKILTDEFVKAYQPGGIYPQRSVTFSAYDLSKLPALNDAMRNLSISIQQAGPAARNAILSKMQHVQTFTYQDYADLIDFMSLLSKTPEQAGINPQQLQDVIAAAKDMIIANKGTKRYGHANGLSIWLPTTHGDFSYRAERYKHLQFSLNTGWNQALDALLQGVDQQPPQQ